MIELGKQALLNRVATIRVVDAIAAEKELGVFVDSKLDRGYRLRIIPCRQTNTLELGAHGTLQLEMAIRRLKESKHFVEQIPFQVNAKLKE